MTIVIFLIIIGILVAGAFLIGFIWSVKSGQYDDMYSPSVRVLFDDKIPEKKKEQTEPEEVEEKDKQETNLTTEININKNQ